MTGRDQANKGNTSHAVRQQRHEPIDSVDDFPTPPWGTRLFLAEILQKRLGDLSGLSAWEPTCNRGYMARPMAEFFARVITSDVAHYGWTGQQHCADFLEPGAAGKVAPDGVDWIMFNPPFAKAEAFVQRALALRPRCGVAMVARSAFLEGTERYDQLYSVSPPWLVAQSSQRLPMHRGRYDPQGGTATAYSWFVWRTGWNAPDAIHTWTPKFRDRYKRASDVGFDQGDRRDWIAEACEATPLFGFAGESEKPESSGEL